MERSADLALIDGCDIFKLARCAGMHRIDQRAVGKEFAIASALSHAACEAANIARERWRPASAESKRNWNQFAKHSRLLAEMLDADTAARLMAQAARIPAETYERIPTLAPLLMSVSELAAALANQKRPEGAPKKWATDWLFAGIAGAYESVAGEPPASDSSRYSPSEQTWRFAQAALKLMRDRIEQRWPGEGADDPGSMAILAAAKLSKETLADRMVSGGERWEASGGELNYSLGNN